MGRVTSSPAPLDGLHVIHSNPAQDARGKFSRLFCESELESIRRGLHFSQINLSETKCRGTVRGMHYQIEPNSEAKLIRCLRGSVFDVAVDLRSGSPTFLHWHGLELSADNDLSVFIPEGFAHGFQTLTDDVQLLYMHTASWSPAHEAGLRHDDPALALSWPLQVSMISDKDLGYGLVDDNFHGTGR